MNRTLQPYRAALGESGITDFALLPGGLLVLFHDGSAYLYTDDVTGSEHVRTMQSLAVAGKGLTTYINRFIRSRFAESLSPDQVAAIRNGC